MLSATAAPTVAPHASVTIPGASAASSREPADSAPVLGSSTPILGGWDSYGLKKRMIVVFGVFGVAVAVTGVAGITVGALSQNYVITGGGVVALVTGIGIAILCRDYLQVKDMDAQVALLKQQNQQYHQENDTFKKTNAALAAQVPALQQAVAQEQANVVQLAAQVAQHKQAVADEKAVVAKLEVQVAQLTQVKTDLEKDVAALSAVEVKVTASAGSLLGSARELAALRVQIAAAQKREEEIDAARAAADDARAEKEAAADAARMTREEALVAREEVVAKQLVDMMAAQKMRSFIDALQRSNPTIYAQVLAKHPLE